MQADDNVPVSDYEISRSPDICQFCLLVLHVFHNILTEQSGLQKARKIQILLFNESE